MESCNSIECPCPKRACPNNGKCCTCVLKHKNQGDLPICLFAGKDGDRSMNAYYQVLKEKFENTDN